MKGYTADIKRRGGRNIITVTRTKAGKKKVSRYYYDASVPVDAYLVATREHDKGTKTNTRRMKKALTTENVATNEWKAYQRYLATVKKRGSLNENLKTGVTATTFNPNQTTSADINRIYAELLGPLVRDKELLGIIIKNAEKFQHRFYYETTIKGVKEGGGEAVLARINDRGHRNIEHYLRDYIRNGIYEPVRTGNSISSTWKLQAARHLRLPGEEFSVLNNGHITNVQTKVTFRRG